DIDMRDTARFRPRWQFRRPALHRRSHGHSRTCREKICVIRPVADLCKEMSTKGNDYKRGNGRRRARGRTLASDDIWLERLRLEVSEFTGQAALRSRGAGANLRRAHVRPRRRGGFQPSRENDITPHFLDRATAEARRAAAAAHAQSAGWRR